MEKMTVSVPFDKEKAVALQIYLGQKNSTLDIELIKTMDSLYSKFVPNLVRDFIQKKEGGLRQKAYRDTPKSGRNKHVKRAV